MSTKQVRNLHLKERDLRDAQIRSMHETKRAKEQRRDEVSVPKFRETGTFFTRNDKQNQTHNSNADICRKAVDYEFVNTVGISAELILRLDSKYWNCKSTNSFIHNHSFWKIRFKKQVTSCSDFTSEAILWNKDVEMVDSLEKVKSPRYVSGKIFPNFEMLDAKFASAYSVSDAHVLTHFPHTACRHRAHVAQGVCSAHVICLHLTLSILTFHPPSLLFLRDHLPDFDVCTFFAELFPIRKRGSSALPT